MLRYGLPAIALALGMVAFGSAAETPAPAPRLKAEFFVRDAFMSPPQVSPDGTRLAWIRGDHLVIFDLEEETEKQVAGTDSLESVQWINNDYLIVYLKSEERQNKTFVSELQYSPLVVSRDGQFLRVLFERDGKKLTATDLKPIIRFIDGPKPYVITMGGNNTYTTDVATGKTKVGPRLMEGQVYSFDREGRERVSAEVIDGKISYGISSILFRYKATPGGKTQSLRLPEQDNIYYTDYDYAEFENAIYWSQFDYGKSESAIYRFDMTTGEKTVVRTGPEKELSLAFDREGRVVGIATLTDRVRTQWTDPYRLKLTAAVEKIFPKATVTITDITSDGKHVVLLVSAPEEPDAYYYYSQEYKDLSQVGVNYPELLGKPLGNMTYITYKARDGLEIPAYVTKRADTPAGAPLIVMPHGGPAARDLYGFDPLAQFLASRGYVVLQPQYRGSAGFGDAFQRAGDKHLDLMNTDLQDGVRYLAAQGTIDPKKVCVVGWSWGGYLAQAALAFTPDTYVCGVSGAGVSDLFQSLKDDNDFWWGGYGIEYWRGVIGRTGSDSDTIRATSPIEHIENFEDPLLLIHGEYDRTVSVRHSERMYEKMKKAGKDVTYIPVKFMQHGPDDKTERLQVFNAVDDFVAKAFAKVDAEKEAN